MAMGEDGYVVLGSRTPDIRPWDGVQRPKVEQGHYVMEVKNVTQGVGTGPKTTGAQEFLYTFGIVSGWDLDTEKPIETAEAGKDTQQRYWDAPNTIGRLENLLIAVDNVPDGENGHYPAAAVGKQFIGEVIHSNSEVDDPTSQTGRRTLTFANVQNERKLPEPPRAQASKPAAGKPAATPPPPQNSRQKPGGAAAARR